MDKVFEANVSTVPPTGPGTANGYPSDGDIDTGTPATVPGAWWFWMITAELLALVVGAGLVPNGAMLNQVFEAVQAIALAAASAAQSAAETFATGAASAAQTAAESFATAAASAAQTAAESFATAAASAAQAAAETWATAAASAAQAAAQNTVLGWFTGSNQSLAVTGYQKLPGGRIFQECDVFAAAAADVDITVTYPIAFPNLGKAPIPSVVDPARAGDESNALILSVISFSNTGCVIGLGENGGGPRDVTLHVEVTGY